MAKKTGYATENTLDDVKGYMSSPTLLNGGRKQLTGYVAEALPDIDSKMIYITADRHNSDLILIGGNDVLFLPESIRIGIPLYPNETKKIYIDNLNKIYLDGHYNDSIYYTYLI